MQGNARPAGFFADGYSSAVRQRQAPAAVGAATGLPGVLSENVIRIPVHVPVNVCGNAVDVVDLLNPAFGNYCAAD